MNVSEIGGFELLQLGKSPQEDMIKAKIEFQRRLGFYDDRLSELHPEYGSFTDVKKAIHHLDMALHEAHEAWDFLEGGWKHHKRSVPPTNWNEVLMELVDVMNFAFNAYAFMGGGPSGRSVAKAVNVTTETEVAYHSIEWVHAWSIGTAAWNKNNADFTTRFSHGDGSFGDYETKECATRVNKLIHSISTCSNTLRDYAGVVGYAAVPPIPGFIYSSIVPWVCAAADTIPGVTPQHFYSAFMRKEQINHKRQDDGY